MVVPHDDQGAGVHAANNIMTLVADMEALRDRADDMGLEMVGFLLEMALAEAKAQRDTG